MSSCGRPIGTSGLAMKVSHSARLADLQKDLSWLKLGKHRGCVALDHDYLADLCLCSVRKR